MEIRTKRVYGAPAADDGQRILFLAGAWQDHILTALSNDRWGER